MPELTWTFGTDSVQSLGYSDTLLSKKHRNNVPKLRNYNCKHTFLYCGWNLCLWLQGREKKKKINIVTIILTPLWGTKLETQIRVFSIWTRIDQSLAAQSVLLTLLFGIALFQLEMLHVSLIMSPLPWVLLSSLPKIYIALKVST